MYKYKITAYVNGSRTETIISASSYDNAKKLFQAQYAGAKIQISHVTKL